MIMTVRTQFKRSNSPALTCISRLWSALTLTDFYLALKLELQCTFEHPKMGNTGVQYQHGHPGTDGYH